MAVRHYESEPGKEEDHLREVSEAIARHRPREVRQRVYYDRAGRLMIEHSLVTDAPVPRAQDL